MSGPSTGHAPAYLWVRRLLCAGVLVIVTGLSAGAHLRHGGNWSFDGYMYATRMLVDRGEPMPRARLAAGRQFAHYARDAHSAALLRRRIPPYWRLFASRPVYPWLASQLWPRFGFQALEVVSEAAYVAGMLALFGLLLEFAPPGIALVIALCVSQFPDVLAAARSTLTDMTAFALIAIAFWSLIRYLRTSSPWSLLIYAAVAGALTFTHPETYVLVFAAAGAGVLALRRRDRRAIAASAVLALIAGAWCAAYVAAAHAAHAPGPVAVFIQQRAGRWPGLTLGEWYVRALGYASVWGLGHAFSMLLPPLGFAALIANRSRLPVGALLGSTFAVVPSLLLDPISGDVARTTLLPLLPALSSGVAIAAAALVARPAARSTDAPFVVPLGRRLADPR